MESFDSGSLHHSQKKEKKTFKFGEDIRFESFHYSQKEKKAANILFFFVVRMHPLI